MNKKQNINRVIWICCCILSLYLNRELRSYGDDFVFAQGISRYGSFYAWLRFYSMNWSGRLIPHGILVLLLQAPNWLFIVFNSAILVFTVYLFVTLFMPADTRIPSFYGIIILSCILFLNHLGGFLSNVILWKCASVLYLWSIAGFFLTIRPLLLVFRGETVTRFQWIMAYIGGIYASSFEQMAAFMMIFLLLLTAWITFIEKKYSKGIWILSVIISIFSISFAAAPGNHIRSQAEVIKWMPYYGMYSFSDKVLIGLFHCLVFIRDYASPFVFVASLFEHILVIKNKKCTKAIRFLSAEPIIYYSLALINRVINTDSVIEKTGVSFPAMNKCFQVIETNVNLFTFDQHVFSTIIALLSLLIFGCLLFFSVSKQNYDPIKPMLFFGSCGTVILTGFSPSIEASGTRVSFLCFAFCAFIVLMLFWEILKTYKENKLANNL